MRSAPGRERVVRGMQDSKSLDGISEACGGGTRAAAGEGRRATISSALELEGTVSHDGDLTHFITKNLEQKIKMSSRPSLDTDCECVTILFIDFTFVITYDYSNFFGVLSNSINHPTILACLFKKEIWK